MAIRVGFGFAFNFISVTPGSLQFNVEYFIHCLRFLSCLRASRILSPKRPVLVLTNPGEIPRLRPWP